MKLVGACFPAQQPIIPESLKHRIDIYYTCELTEVERDAFSKVLVGLEQMLKLDITIKPELWVHVIFVGSPILYSLWMRMQGAVLPLSSCILCTCGVHPNTPKSKSFCVWWKSFATAFGLFATKIE